MKWDFYNHILNIFLKIDKKLQVWTLIDCDATLRHQHVARARPR